MTAVRAVLSAVLLLASTQALAQTSASYKLQEQVLNNGGHPAQGTVLTSPSFRIRLDAIGGPPVGAGSSSGSYRLEHGFVPAYLPPSEVTTLSFPTKTDLQWTPHPAAGTYAVYRGASTSFPGNYGGCFLTTSASTAQDADVTAPGKFFFYLVTVRNRLSEEGTKGFTTNGERPNPAPCP